MTQQEYDYARAACSRPSMSKTDLTAARTPTPDVLPAPPVADTRRRGLLEPPNGAEERMTMGLDTTHGCWSGPYSAFGAWRKWLASRVGIPLPLMQGFCSGFQAAPEDHGESNPYELRWDRYPPLQWRGDDPLFLLLNHSDCDGSIRWQDAASIADRLDEVATAARQEDVPDGLGAGRAREERAYNIAACERFSVGLRLAFSRQEDVEFH